MTAGRSHVRMPAWGIAAVLLVTAFVYPAVLLFDKDTVITLGLEDAAIENIGALAYFVASLLSIQCYRASSATTNRFFGRPTRRNVYFLLLAIFFFVCAGEEISWGQRLFDWATPASWQSVNAQRETNFHNLWLFQATNPDGSMKSQSELMLYPGRLIILLWAAYCLVVPFLYVHHEKARALLAKTGVPVPAILCGAFFLTSYAARKVWITVLDVPEWALKTLSELQETSFAVLFAVMAFLFLKGIREDRAEAGIAHDAQAGGERYQRA